jgi:hypothetical protein
MILNLERKKFGLSLKSKLVHIYTIINLIKEHLLYQILCQVIYYYFEFKATIIFTESFQIILLETFYKSIYMKNNTETNFLLII